MKDKVVHSFDAAVADMRDGARIAIYHWGQAGMAQNLILAVRNKGVQNLTIITNGFGFTFIGASFPTEEEVVGPFALRNQVKKLITPIPSIPGMRSPFEEKVRSGEVEVELLAHGMLAERLRAGGSGIGGFYSTVGIGTILDQGKERKIIDGKEHVLEKPLRADFGLVRAYKADEAGNLIYRGAGRGLNPIIAMASDVTIAEVDEIVGAGELDPEAIVTPGIFVDRIVKVADGGLGSFQRRAELRRKYLGGGQK